MLIISQLKNLKVCGCKVPGGSQKGSLPSAESFLISLKYLLLQFQPSCQSTNIPFTLQVLLHFKCSSALGDLIVKVFLSHFYDSSGGQKLLSTNSLEYAQCYFLLTVCWLICDHLCFQTTFFQHPAVRRYKHQKCRLIMV